MSPSTPPDSITTLSAHLDHLASMEQEAKELMPFKVDECSFPQGSVRQKVWSCRTCATEGNEVGVCYACSVSCHAEHDLVELFTRRSFTCDCPTTPHCTLLRTRQPPNERNKYTRNFRGEFCRCERGKTYDPMEEAESMLECLGCEDWFHESCLNLQDPQNPIPTSDNQSTASTSTVESPLLPSSSYAHLLCARCILASPLLKQYAGTEGWMMIVPRPEQADANWADRWEVIGTQANVGDKRKSAPGHDDEATLSKRTKLSPTTNASSRPTQCTLPVPNPIAQSILASLTIDAPTESTAKGDVFLLPSARESICTCESCAPLVRQLPFPLEEEEEYLPAMEDPNDPSEEELTSQALSSLPRSQTIEALLAFNSMKDKLKAFLEPFSHGERVVSAQDIGEFMQSVKEGGK